MHCKNMIEDYEQNSPITIIDIGTARIIPTKTVQPTKTTQQRPNERYMMEPRAIRNLKPPLKTALPPSEQNRLKYRALTTVQ